ncbi:hypothetical protein ACFLU8_04285 [Chloroflexota bacterium]
MSKRMKVLVAMLAAVFVLAIGSTAFVMAQEKPTPAPEAGVKGLLTRIAGILNIPEEDLSNAFKQAQEEMRQEALQRFIDKAIDEGRITQEEADEYLEWWEQRPETCDRVMQRACSFNAIRGRHMQQQGIMPMRGGTATPPWLGEQPSQ